jgi:L-seryl-tRNA(Ser) seleniumtransferase
VTGTAQQTIPTLRALTEPLADVRKRARRVLGRLSSEVREQLAARIVEDHAQVGGGALPTVQLPTAGVALGATPAAARALDAALRVGEPPVIGRMLDDRIYLDCRTVLPTQVAALATAISGAAARLVTTERTAASEKP